MVIPHSEEARTYSFLTQIERETQEVNALFRAPAAVTASNKKEKTDGKMREGE